MVVGRGRGGLEERPTCGILPGCGIGLTEFNKPVLIAAVYPHQCWVRQRMKKPCMALSCEAYKL